VWVENFQVKGGVGGKVGSDNSRGFTAFSRNCEGGGASVVRKMMNGTDEALKKANNQRGGWGQCLEPAHAGKIR